MSGKKEIEFGNEFSKLSLNEKEEQEQHLKYSTYTISESFNMDLHSLILECNSLHPLQQVNPYQLDLDSSNNKPKLNENVDINTLMQGLDLSNTTATDNTICNLSMPYCA